MAEEGTGGGEERFGGGRRQDGGYIVRDDEALSSSDVERLLGVPAKDARAALLRRVAQGDKVPLKVRDVWLAPLWWWRDVLDVTGGS